MNDPADGLPEELERELDVIRAAPGAERAARLQAASERFPEHALEIQVLGRLFAEDDADQGARGETIGPYELLDTIGEGGMGTVFLARQEVPLRRRVALKLIKPGMDSKAVVSRFEQERQALALMDHHGIAKVFDCGTTERGQPYFVMEYVDGLPIDVFCDRHELSLEDRLALFQQVCSAVEHAHQKGVVHRDLKPSNVLVTGRPSEPQVKVIDFGLVKAMGEQLVDASLFTQLGQVVGTPEYMAPEQADPGNRDIDTRADVYSLGVLLYRLLVGELPFSAEDLRRGGLLEIQRILKTEEPPRPSSRLSTVEGSSVELANARRIKVGRLRAVLRNDLDWVVLRALEKDRERRYATADALSEEIQRFLDHEPLQAGPPSATYRLRKLARRYRPQVITAAAVLVTAIVGAVAASGYAISAGRLATEKAALATEKIELAEQKTELAERLDRQVQEYRLLASAVRYDEVVAAEQELVPAWPHRIADFERWLADDYGQLRRSRDEIDAAIERLRVLALPWSGEEQRADLEAFDQHDRYVRLLGLADALDRANRVRAGEEPEVVEPGPEWDGRSVNELAAAAVRRTQPLASIEQKSLRSIWGEEALGLALARRAEEIGGPEFTIGHLQILADALLENGLDDEALEVGRDALARLPERARAQMAAWFEQMQRAAASRRVFQEEVEVALAGLEDDALCRRTFSFPPEHAAAGLLFRQLVDLAGQLREMETLHEPRVRRRLDWARRIEALTRAHPNARVTWEEVRAGIAASPKYAGAALEVGPEQCMGLVPLGENPVTGLFEFYHLRSAWDEERDPATLEIPALRSDGSIDFDDFTGIVFVLLPGGRQVVGRPDGAPPLKLETVLSGLASPAVEVDLEPFFLARHELTKGQWFRLWTGSVAGRRPCSLGLGSRPNGIEQRIDGRHPVENVDWPTSRRLLHEHGLALPLDDQWEYACRAGTTTPWYCAKEQLPEHANLCDAFTRRYVSTWLSEDWSDGFYVHAPVGSFQPNGFGLFDMHGNVSEWCEDVPASSGWTTSERCSRGGSFVTLAELAMSERRTRCEESYRRMSHGLRAARPLRRAGD